jgi:hypothetical protein
MKYSDEEYINADPFPCEDVLYRKTKMVKTRKRHWCYVAGVLIHEHNPNPHEIPIGEFAVFETGKVEGEWGKVYSCIKCLDKYLDEMRENNE